MSSTPTHHSLFKALKTIAVVLLSSMDYVTLFYGLKKNSEKAELRRGWSSPIRSLIQIHESGVRISMTSNI